MDNAEPVPLEHVDVLEKVWPHHPVLSENKPRKVRVVFDCASKFKGESLNDKAYQGPDLNSKLMHVMTRFRREPYATLADIEAIYNQVKVPVYDRDAPRFLWCDKQDYIRHLRMTSHMFGGVWCSSAAIYALHRICQDKDVSSEVKNAIFTSFYVDDCLVSVNSVAKAEKLVSDLEQCLGVAGFRLTEFASNEEEVLFDLPRMILQRRSGLLKIIAKARH